MGVALVFVLRPLAGWVALSVGKPSPRAGARVLGPRERRATALLGVRGVGSLYYIAYATSKAEFGDNALLWSTVAFTVALSVLVHGIAAKPIMQRLDNARAA